MTSAEPIAPCSLQVADKECQPDPERTSTSERQLTSPKGGAIVVWTLVSLLVALIYWSTFVELVSVWNIDPNYSHGFMVPLASLVMAYAAWKQRGTSDAWQATRVESCIGLAEIAVGICVHVLAWLSTILLLDVISLLIVLRGTLMVMGGRQAARTYGFAVFFLIFMAPLPAQWYDPLAITMQQIVSGVSTVFLEACGAAVYREGYFIHLPDYTMEVGQACSGIRQLTAVLALACAVGYLLGRGKAYCWLLALLSIPIAIAANCVRVMLTGVIMMLFGKRWAEGVFHTLEGMVIVALAAAMVLGAAWCLTRLEAKYRREAPAP